MGTLCIMILNALVTCSATVPYSAKIMPHTLSENYILLPHFIYKINALKKMACLFPGVDRVALICSSYHRVYKFVRFEECNGCNYGPS